MDMWHEFRSRIRYKIIIPFLMLTLFVALSGAAIVFFIAARAAQRDFDNQLVDVARVVNHALVDQERANLQYLIEIVFAPRNESVNAPSVADGTSRSDSEGLAKALKPYFLQGMRRTMVRIDRLIAFDRHGHTLVDFERTNRDTKDFISNTPIDISNTWFVPSILQSQEDTIGDKYAGLLYFPSSATQNAYYFATIAPVVEHDQVVGGVIAAMYVDDMIKDIAQKSKADVLLFYDNEGHPLVSTIQAQEGIGSLTIRKEILANLSSSASSTTQDVQQTHGQDNVVSDIVTINSKPYQLTFTSLAIRSTKIGIVASGRLREGMMKTWDETRFPLFVIVGVLVLGIISLGVVIARNITVPLEELVDTAKSVMAGNFERRSKVSSHDEIGVLSSSFNQMTEHLLELFSQVLAESGQRAAIVESIGDGIIVCDEKGVVQLVNRATYRILGLSDHATLPGNINDLPLVKVEEAVFGTKQEDLYAIGDNFVRVIVTPWVTIEEDHLGSVYVLQDMTDEVRMDRAKTTFIATISHEMKTPLTSMRGNLDMLVHGIAGALNEQQRPMIETISSQTTNMTKLVNNMIVVAGLDSGSTIIELEPVNLKQVVDKAIWPLRKGLTNKKLTLKLEIPADLPLIEADPIQLRTVMQQLIENARVYTDQGGITVRATRELDHVRVDVIDTGCGIDLELQERIFDRFVRGKGDESNDRPDRGIGLGLAIVKTIIELHHGRVWVTSTPGQGSTFSFTLRYKHEKEDSGKKPVSTAA